MPLEILTRLLKGEHVNVDERKALGLWPCEALQYNEVATHLSKILESESWFPQPVPTAGGGAPIHEGIYIQRQGENRFVCIAQRTLANNPSALAEKTERVFESSREAADFYMKWELNLPGRLDGWPVV